MVGNTNTDEKEKPHINKKEHALINKPSSSRLPPTSCSQNRNLDLKEKSSSVQESLQLCQSLVSPKTLLNGTTTPLWAQNGSRSGKKEAVANLSSSVMNCTTAQMTRSNSLVLCSVTVGCLSNLPQPKQLSEAVATAGLQKDGKGGELSVETEDRCGSYDDVLLEGDDVAEGEYISAFDSGCVMWDEPHRSHSTRDLFTLRDSMSDDNSKTEMTTTELSTTSVSTKMPTPGVNTSNQSAKMRQRSLVSESNAYFAGNKTEVCYKTNQFHETSDGLPRNSFRPKAFVPEQTSTPNTSFAKPRPVKHKPAPKSSFTIYTDPAKKAATPSFPTSHISLYTPKNTLLTLSTNTLSSSRSSLPVKLKGGGQITSPLCTCGRRAKRQVVSNGGPNHGRGFYCCPVRRSGSGGRIQKGCEFFKWESSVMKSTTLATPTVRSSKLSPTTELNTKKKLLMC